MIDELDKRPLGFVAPEWKEEIKTGHEWVNEHLGCYVGDAERNATRTPARDVTEHVRHQEVLTKWMGNKLKKRKEMREK